MQTDKVWHVTYREVGRRRGILSERCFGGRGWGWACIRAVIIILVLIVSPGISLGQGTLGPGVNITDYILCENFYMYMHTVQQCRLTSITGPSVLAYHICITWHLIVAWHPVAFYRYTNCYITQAQKLFWKFSSLILIP